MVVNLLESRLAENWDMRLGVPLWNIIASVVEENGTDVTEVGSNFIIMTLSELSPSTFNDYLQNTFKKTNKGVMMTKELVDTIMYNKEVDDFNNFIQVQNDKFPINDDAAKNRHCTICYDNNIIVVEIGFGNILHITA